MAQYLPRDPFASERGHPPARPSAPSPRSRPAGRSAGTPRVVGRAGAGLRSQTSKATWASSEGAARAGLAGEQKTAQILNDVAESVRREGRVVVLHDLTIPGTKANIDHAVLVSGATGSRIFLIDSKVWKPGGYWTMPAFPGALIGMRGRTYRGTSRFPSAEKHTMEMATDRLLAYLDKAGSRAVIEQPWVVVWPSSNRVALRLSRARVPGARLVHGERFESLATRTFRARIGAGTVDEHTLGLLSALVTSTGRAHRDPNPIETPTLYPASSAPLGLDEHRWGA